MDKMIPLPAMDYAYKLNAINKLLLYDPLFKNELSDVRINDIIEMYDVKLEDFKILNYTNSEIFEIVKKGVSGVALAFERITDRGQLIHLYELDVTKLIPNNTYIGGKSIIFWEDITNNIKYTHDQILFLNFSFFFDYLANKYDMLEQLGKRPNISEYIKKLDRDNKINQIVNDTI